VSHESNPAIPAIITEDPLIIGAASASSEYLTGCSGTHQESDWYCIGEKAEYIANFNQKHYLLFLYTTS